MLGEKLRPPTSNYLRLYNVTSEATVVPVPPSGLEINKNNPANIPKIAPITFPCSQLSNFFAHDV
jgi:hypothetical protein